VVTNNFGYLLCCYVADNEAKAQESEAFYLAYGRTTRGRAVLRAARLPPAGWPGAARRRTSESKPLGEQNIEAWANYHVVPAPDTVLKKPLSQSKGSTWGIWFYNRESRMSHEATMRSIELFGKEVMPAIREW
jgi:hypothetical protein